MEKKYIYRCEDSAEGILTGIYDAWAAVHSHQQHPKKAAVLSDKFRPYLLCLFQKVSNSGAEIIG